MKFKSSKNSFLIRYSTTTSSIAKAVWLTALTATISVFPGFKVEGLTTESRPTTIEEKSVLALVRDDKNYVEYGEYITKTRNVIGVGVNGKYNVSFEDANDFRMSSFLPIYTVPVYDLEKDLDLIIGKLRAYVAEVAVKKEKKECVNVTYHSNFIRVGNSRIDYDDEKDIKKLLKKATAKPTRYNLKSIHVI